MLSSGLAFGFGESWLGSNEITLHAKLSLPGVMIMNLCSLSHSKRLSSGRAGSVTLSEPGEHLTLLTALFLGETSAVTSLFSF